MSKIKFSAVQFAMQRIKTDTKKAEEDFRWGPSDGFLTNSPVCKWTFNFSHEVQMAG
jgi:hypothetical protein